MEVVAEAAGGFHVVEAGDDMPGDAGFFRDGEVAGLVAEDAGGDEIDLMDAMGRDGGVRPAGFLEGLAVAGEGNEEGSEGEEDFHFLGGKVWGFREVARQSTVNAVDRRALPCGCWSRKGNDLLEEGDDGEGGGGEGDGGGETVVGEGGGVDARIEIAAEAAVLGVFGGLGEDEEAEDGREDEDAGSEDDGVEELGEGGWLRGVEGGVAVHEEAEDEDGGAFVPEEAGDGLEGGDEGGHGGVSVVR